MADRSATSSTFRQAIASVMLLVHKSVVLLVKQSHFATRGSVNPTGHSVIGPTIIKTHSSACENQHKVKSKGRWNHT
jgi:hypothetical protein